MQTDVTSQNKLKLFSCLSKSWLTVIYLDKKLNSSRRSFNTKAGDSLFFIFEFESTCFIQNFLYGVYFFYIYAQKTLADATLCYSHIKIEKN